MVNSSPEHAVTQYLGTTVTKSKPSDQTSPNISKWYGPQLELALPNTTHKKHPNGYWTRNAYTKDEKNSQHNAND